MHLQPYSLHRQEEAQAVMMFEALLDSAAAEGYTSSQSGETEPSSKGSRKSWLGALANPNPNPSPNPP